MSKVTSSAIRFNLDLLVDFLYCDGDLQEVRIEDADTYGRFSPKAWAEVRDGIDNVLSLLAYAEEHPPETQDYIRHQVETCNLCRKETPEHDCLHCVRFPLEEEEYEYCD